MALRGEEDSLMPVQNQRGQHEDQKLHLDKDLGF